LETTIDIIMFSIKSNINCDKLYLKRLSKGHKALFKNLHKYFFDHCRYIHSFIEIINTNVEAHETQLVRYFSTTKLQPCLKVLLPYNRQEQRLFYLQWDQFRFIFRDWKREPRADNWGFLCFHTFGCQEHESNAEPWCLF
jgi:hypothetical protein